MNIDTRRLFELLSSLRYINQKRLLQHTHTSNNTPTAKPCNKRWNCAGIYLLTWASVENCNALVICEKCSGVDFILHCICVWVFSFSLPSHLLPFCILLCCSRSHGVSAIFISVCTHTVTHAYKYTHTHAPVKCLTSCTHNFLKNWKIKGNKRSK